ncbi:MULTISPECIES: RHS repeat domain-containing protein [unclassified Treponema]|uniref:RHS repeat domain-containing protein n=1 Tax=unclassified Treponema TaxID=2638727 RepID=UPI0020A619F4|nr:MULTISPECIES: toxin TcdB middle/N-terminal domain-containing protein [unclassified Treponema]
MKPKLFIYSQPNYLIRTAIAREQKQFIKIAFAVHLSAVISAERYRSDSVALKSAVFNFVFFIMLKNKIEQSAKTNSLLDSPTDRTFENRRSRYKEPSKNKAEAYRVYVELILRSDAGDARIFSKEQEYTTYYTYEDGYYNRAEKEFYGFKTVRSKNAIGTVTETEYYIDSYYRKGMVKREIVQNGSTIYSIKEYETDAAPHARIKKETTTIRENYNEIKTESEYDYDKYGNVTKLYDKGDVTNTNDDLIAEITYWKGGREEAYFKAHPEKIHVLHGKTGTLLRKREGAYDSRTGALTELKQYTSHGAYLVNRIEWTDEGNIKAVTSPTGKRAEYKYLDGIYPIEIKEISSKGDKSYTSKIEWDRILGVKLKETDAANNTMSYKYDNFGRVTEVRSPYDTSETPYAKYTYITPSSSFWYTVTENKISTEAKDSGVMKTIVIHDGLGRISYTAKEGEVYIDGTNDQTQTGWNISSTIHYDKAGRKSEEGMPFFYGGDLENNLKTISSYQAIEQFYELNDFTKIRNGTKYEYDDIDRNILTTLPDGHKQKTEYSIDSSLQITKTTDPKENISISKKDARGNIREVERLDKNNTILTKARYEYSVLGEMLRAYDANENLLSVSYDLLGRRTALESKDTGKKEWIYDDKGRLQAETDSVLKNKAAEIRYEYDGFDRILKTDYPFSQDIEYKYGEPEQKGAGRVIYKKDETGETKYKYGYLNEVTSETRTINRYGAGSSPETASFEYRSDYLGRMQSMKYPDGEVITYTYDAGGQLKGVSGAKTTNKGSIKYSYVDKILYDEHSQRVYIKYGNGVETRYKYDEKRRWLDTIETKNNQTQDIFQKIKYSFDPVGNVLGYNNDASTYETKQTYSYDNLYQLISVEGTSNQYKAKKSSGTTPVSIAKYRQTFAFDGIGNMKEKISTTNIPGAQGNSYPKAELDYSLQYEYDPAYAHRLIKAGNRYYRYDANGNITAEKDGPFTDEEEFVFTYSYFEEQDVYGADYGFGLDAPKETEQSNPQDLFAYRRNYTWNERNLLTKSSDRNYTVHYRYGEDGQRALKYTDEGRSETLYFNNFFTIHIPTQDQNNPQGLRVHKHIFVGNSRLVTAMTHTDNQGDNEEQKVKRYYYHSDHLGSAQFVTDWRGKQYEHIEYTPYGELWIEEVAVGLDKLPFRFTGKELDEETGLYYYGARYLDPKYSRWLSGDPALNDYIPKAPINDEAKKHNDNLPGMGGVFNTVNLHVYHYAENNPVKYTDPDGKQTATAILNAKWKCLVQNLNQYIEMKHQVQDKIIKINHEINRKKGEIYDIAFNSVYKEINDFVNFYDIFDNSINAAMSNSGSFNMMLIAFLINIDVDALSGYLVDAYYAENMQTTGNEVNTSIFTKLMEIREMKAINASNKAELDNIEIEIADIKKKINELKLGDY